jgi:hypothetical protein
MGPHFDLLFQPIRLTIYQSIEAAMNQNSVFQDFQSLPPEAQRQVADFIAFLQARHKPATARRKAKQSNLSDEAFIGMWRDRTDMQNSTEWVRNLRKREWGQGNE